MARRQALSLLFLAAVVLIAGCTSADGPPPRNAPGATELAIVTSDGVFIDARLWDREADRVAIFLHEYREDQSTWWNEAGRPRVSGVSTMTFDFRGHGASEGEVDDLEGMVLDAHAAVSEARARGYEQIMLVGAGMGSAVAIVAATELPEVTVVGFSTPADFDLLDPIEVAANVGDRVELYASRDDVSAADSLLQFRAAEGLDLSRTHLYPGSSHGVEMLEGRAGADIRARFDALLEEFWLLSEASAAG